MANENIVFELSVEETMQLAAEAHTPVTKKQAKVGIHAAFVQLTPEFEQLHVRLQDLAVNLANRVVK